MKVARFLVSYPLLAEVLHLPPLSDIRYVGNGGADMFEVIVEHPDLNDIEPVVGDEKPPLVSPMFRRQDPVVFEGWGQK